MRTEHYKLAVTLLSASALLLFNELDAYSYFRRRTPARAPREQDADANLIKHPGAGRGRPSDSGRAPPGRHLPRPRQPEHGWAVR